MFLGLASLGSRDKKDTKIHLTTIQWRWRKVTLILDFEPLSAENSKGSTVSSLSLVSGTLKKDVLSVVMLRMLLNAFVKQFHLAN